MPDPELANGDVFYVIGFTGDDILAGAQFRTMRLSTENLKAGSALHQRLGSLALAEQRGLVVKKLVEVYFVDPFSFLGDDRFERQFGDGYQTVEFFNETAFQLCNHYRIELPPVIGKLTRAELPDPLGTSLRFPCYFPR